MNKKDESKDLKNSKLDKYNKSGIQNQNSNKILDQIQVNDIMQSMNTLINTETTTDRKLSKNSTTIEDTKLSSKDNENGLIIDADFQSNFPQLEEIDDFVDDIKNGDAKIEDDIDHDWLQTFLDETNRKGLQVAKRNYYLSKLKFNTDKNPEELDALLTN